MGADDHRKVKIVGLAAIYSILLLNEGTVRLIRSATPDHEHSYGGSHTEFPLVVLLIGAVFEVLIAVVGILVALASLLYEVEHIWFTKSAMVLNSTIGWFYFVVYVFADPAFNINRKEPEDFPLSRSYTTGARVMSIIASFCFCMAVLGGQFVFLHGMAQFQLKKEDEVLTKRYYRSRLIGYSLLPLLSGLSILTMGAILQDQAGAGKLEFGPYVYPPCIVWYPELTIVTGILLFLFGVYGVLSAVLTALLKVFAPVAALMWLWLVSVLALAQPGLTPGGGSATPGSVVMSLSLALILLPAYFAGELRKMK
eukprot:TRINITY_DN317_c0_g1_i1.p1 TRINITY_DN317_c0_g1~~TRINITY_DN317_c0_g1_i1.p1  ORF type:complete len:311 (+),score=34.93 TRINITY_DN317_c0_g1_i1:204-1136(+)